MRSLATGTGLNTLAAHSLQATDMLPLQDTPRTIKLIATHTDNTRATILKGSTRPAQVQHALRGFDGWRAALELRCVMQGGLRVLEKIKTHGYRALSQRPKLSRWDAVVVLWRALRQSTT